MMTVIDSPEVVDYDLPPLPGDGFSLGATQPGLLIVRTGILMGPVELEIQVYTSTPPLDSGPWEDVEELTMETLTGVFTVFDTNGPPSNDFAPVRFGAPSEAVRVRVSSAGRDERSQEIVDEVKERYLIEVWPGNLDEQPTVLRHSSEYVATTSLSPANKGGWALVTEDGAVPQHDRTPNRG
ncbi:hypothetical protein HQ325_16605 [Rhodococcus sp. BP-349]|uniref:hypothetical protein n=1 Tax=unclassified Rhodococcus (in: high G+C Gram-positive bacteria) TaxID=192944 RepID=UPI001C9A6D36|nr:MULTISPECIES: hypothetical protein [unclassified Rhodococcus (in: high G+C Gram-positive bacteria)]MBY6540296.1 hypothetical protein [Rhodococcus sp. BP-363]MBY6545679.1 hypothetical protein [Rhodococcus sp. BP-369]MBY6564909.1 hypothetical protein [Rhodococcus sp. BP-370]MBY6578155.1 hypothetical protein [Rhodococcus sp. BP-364]MBY6587456.1 hypothetical protein [Rhodococcus sp. BP-358]